MNDMGYTRLSVRCKAVEGVMITAALCSGVVVCVVVHVLWAV